MVVGTSFPVRLHPGDLVQNECVTFKLEKKKKKCFISTKLTTRAHRLATLVCRSNILVKVIY